MVPEKVKSILKWVALILKWIYRVLNYAVRAVLLAGLLYAIAFSLAGTYAIYRAFDYGYKIYEGVDTLKYNQPEMSSYMRIYQDSNPELQLKHIYTPLDSISPYLRKAVLASEDAGFYYHPGFDIRAITEALDANQMRGKNKFGGSTITQQLAKNMFLSSERSFERKGKELAYALLMEKKLGKDRILELYLNYAQWGKDIFGCEAACKEYYKKNCNKISVDQAISLAAVLASPEKHTPFMRNSNFMASRRSVIYQNMFPKKDSVMVDSLKALSAPDSDHPVSIITSETPQ